MSIRTNITRINPTRNDMPAEVPVLLGLMRYVLPRAMLRANLAPALSSELTTVAREDCYLGQS